MLAEISSQAEVRARAEAAELHAAAEAARAAERVQRRHADAVQEQAVRHTAVQAAEEALERTRAHKEELAQEAARQAGERVRAHTQVLRAAMRQAEEAAALQQVQLALSQASEEQQRLLLQRATVQPSRSKRSSVAVGLDDRRAWKEERLAWLSEVQAATRFHAEAAQLESALLEESRKREAIEQAVEACKYPAGKQTGDSLHGGGPTQADDKTHADETAASSALVVVPTVVAAPTAAVSPTTSISPTGGAPPPPPAEQPASAPMGEHATQTAEAERDAAEAELSVALVLAGGPTSDVENESGIERLRAALQWAERAHVTPEALSVGEEALERAVEAAVAERVVAAAEAEAEAAAAREAAERECRTQEAVRAVAAADSARREAARLLQLAAECGPLSSGQPSELRSALDVAREAGVSAEQISAAEMALGRMEANEAAREAERAAEARAVTAAEPPPSALDTGPGPSGPSASEESLSAARAMLTTVDAGRDNDDPDHEAAHGGLDARHASLSRLKSVRAERAAQAERRACAAREEADAFARAQRRERSMGARLVGTVNDGLTVAAVSDVPDGALSEGHHPAPAASEAQVKDLSEQLMGARRRAEAAERDAQAAHEALAGRDAEVGALRHELLRLRERAERGEALVAKLRAYIEQK